MNGDADFKIRRFSNTKMSPDNAFWTEKYASAFLNVFYKTIPEGLIERFLTLHDFFNFRKRLFVNLFSPSVRQEEKHAIIKSIADSVGLNQDDLKMLHFLLKKGKILNLGHISKQIAKIAARRSNTTFCEVFSSDTLGQDERKVVMEFLQKSMDSTPMVSFYTDKSLISGIRIESDCFFYEKSIKSRTRVALTKLRSLLQ